MNDFENSIKEKLNTKILGRDLIYLKEIGSTQEYIKDNLRNKLENGLVVITENQTKGKGTNGKSWYTKAGENLTFSFLLKPNCNINNLKNLTITIANVMIETIRRVVWTCA